MDILQKQNLLEMSFLEESFDVESLKDKLKSLKNINKNTIKKMIETNNLKQVEQILSRSIPEDMQKMSYIKNKINGNKEIKTKYRKNKQFIKKEYDIKSETIVEGIAGIFTLAKKKIPTKKELVKSTSGKIGRRIDIFFAIIGLALYVGIMALCIAFGAATKGFGFFFTGPIMVGLTLSMIAEFGKMADRNNKRKYYERGEEGNEIHITTVPVEPSN